MQDFTRLKRLPPYIFSVMDQLKAEVIKSGKPVFDFGLGNPDQPTPPHIVEALRKASLNPALHRYIPTRGMLPLREAIVHWYQQRFNVTLNPETEAMVTIGSKEGLAHLALATCGEGDSVLVPNPCYPVHQFGFVIADAKVISIPALPNVDFIDRIKRTIAGTSKKPKLLIINYPGNPTTECVDLDFFSKIIAIAKEHQIWVVHDLAYADIVFDGYKAPSILQVPGAKDIAVEFFTLSKSYNMAGWRMGFMCGNAQLVSALTKIKSYLDYGTFGAIQMAAIAALEGPQDCVKEICALYQHRRDVMCEGLNAAGWKITKPKASMFLWAEIPHQFKSLGSLEFAKLLLKESQVVVSPGIGFGEYGDQFVRIGLVENDQNMQEALQQIAMFMKKDFSQVLYESTTSTL